jgi:hypothetical protein
MPCSKKFDVFLSHHSSDKPWVIKLKDELEARGLRVWLDKDQIRPGDLFAKSIEQGLQSSRTIVFVVTANSMKSKWVEEEYYRALNLSKSKRQPAQLIPVIYQMASLPGFLASRNWVDFRNELEFSQNLEKLVWGITGRKETGSKAVEIPFVIAAMTATQAGELFEGTVLLNPSFSPFKQALLGLGNFDYKKLYGVSPEDWKFSPHPEKGITDVVWHTLLVVNEKKQDRPGSILFTPRFRSLDFFSTDFNHYTKAWQSLKQLGCVLIVDAVSLFHPQIMQRLNDFHVEPDDNVAMVIISPLDTFTHPLTQMIEAELKAHLQMAYVKSDSSMGIQCSFDIGSLRSFKRWAITALPELAELVRNRKPTPSNRKYLRQEMGAPSGIDALIFGTAGEE